MRRTIVLLAAALLVSCSSSSSSDDPDTTRGESNGSEQPTATVAGPSGTTEQESTAPGSTEAAQSGGGGDVDCAAVRAAITQFGVPVQLMAQVRDPENLQAIEDGVMAPLDIDAFLAAVDDLRVLEAHPSPLGSPTESLDRYEEVGLALKDLFAKESVTQADIDAYNDKVGTVTDFLGKQVAISGSIDAAGC